MIGMKNASYLLILLLFYCCKTEQKSNTDYKKPSGLTIEEPVEVFQKDNKSYVIAKSGLNFRDKPKGKIIGKFEFGEGLKIIKHTNSFEEILDENKLIKGEWLGVKVADEPELKYVFGGFLANKKEFKIINNDISKLIPFGYEIEYKAEGDLNNDAINDVAVVVKRKENFHGDRDVVIFLKENGVNRINKISKTAFPSKFYGIDNDMEIYDGEYITISDNKLIIEVQGTGPIGSLSSKYNFFGKKLLLTNVSTYNMGAGSHVQRNLDMLKGRLTTTTMNTMKEDMPSETTTKDISIKEYQFENANPRDIILKVN